MTRFVEPTRWLDPRSDVPADVQRLIADSRDALSPTQDELARLGAFVGSAGIGGAAAAAGKAAALRAGTRALTKAGALKLAAVLAVGAAGGGVGWSVLRNTAASPAVPVVETSNVGASPVPAFPPSPEAVPPSDDEPPASTAPALSVAPSPASVSSVHTTTAPPVTAPIASPPASASPSPPPATTLASSADPGAEVLAAGVSELALLDRARASLAANPADAMRALDEHRTRYRNGTFAQEREVLAIDALLRMGRRPEAEARAAEFATAFPGSAHRRRIAVLLGQDGQDGGR